MCPSGSKASVRAAAKAGVLQEVFIEANSIAWPNGVDIAPEALYEAEDLRKRRPSGSKR
jgi:hypothetical protein